MPETFTLLTPFTQDPWRLVLAASLALTLAITGLGLPALRLCGRRVEDAEDILVAFWVGWCSLVLFLGLWHFAGPIDDAVLPAVGAASAAGWLLFVLDRGRRGLASLARGALRHAPAIALLLAAAAWLSNRALGGPGNGDTGYYFVPTMAWMKAHALVPGLANLSAPLAYNQSYFRYAALLETGPFVEASHHLANVPLLLVTLARCLLGASRALRRGGGDAADLFHLAMTPVVLHLGFDHNMNSTAPDFAVFVLGVVLSGELLAMMTRRGSHAPAPAAFALLAASAVTVKLSLAPLAVSAGALGFLALAWRARRLDLRTLLAFVVPTALVLAPWMAGNVVMSGYPLYPSSFAPVDVPWRVPADIAALIRESSSFHAPLEMFWKNPAWAMTSLESLGWKTPEVLVPLGMAAVALPLLFLRLAATALLRLAARLRAAARPREATQPEGAPKVSAVPGRFPATWLLPTVAALVAWFLLAPRPRFAGAAIWLLGVQALLVAPGRLWGTATGRGVLGLTVVGATAAALATAGPLLLPNVRFQPWAQPVLAPRPTASGLAVTEPQYMSCWDELLCTPTPHPGLVALDPEDLGAGFRVETVQAPGPSTEKAPEPTRPAPVAAPAPAAQGSSS